MVWLIENYAISKMCFFCSGNLENDLNFPEGLLSQLRLKLVIERAHVFFTDQFSEQKGMQERLRGKAAKSIWSPQRSHPAYIPQAGLGLGHLCLQSD